MMMNGNTVNVTNRNENRKESEKHTNTHIPTESIRGVTEMHTDHDAE